MKDFRLTGYIIEKYSDMKSAYTCKRLKEEALANDISLDIIGVHDVCVVNDKIYCGNNKINSCDFVINRYKWGNIKHEVALLATRQYNNQKEFEKYINKYEQVKMLRSKEFLIPKFCLATATKRFAIISNLLGSPFVAKGLENSQGSEIYLIGSQNDMDSLISQYGINKEWLFEEFIEFSYGRDIRVYSIRGNVIACMTRKSKGDFRANVALGATVESFEVSPSIECISKDIYFQTGLDFLGIDLLFGKEKPFLCEINVMPGIEGIEKATGVNVAKKIIETIEGDFKHE